MPRNVTASAPRRRSRRATYWTLAAIFLALAAGCGESSPPDLEQQVDQHLSKLKSMRFFATVLRYHPEAETDIRGRLTEAIKASKSQSPQEGAYGAQVLIAGLMSDYVQKDIQNASAAALYASMRQEADVLQRLRRHPELCVNYVMGKPYFDAPEITPEVLKKEGDVAADLIESAYTHPEPLTQAPSAKEVTHALMAASAVFNVPLKDISDLQNVADLPPERGCVVLTQFSKLLFQLGPQLGPLTFKQLTYSSKQ